MKIVTLTGSINTLSKELTRLMDKVCVEVDKSQSITQKMAVRSNEITEVIENLASVSEESSASLQEISASTEEMNAQVAEVHSSAQSLSGMAQNLKAIIVNFKLVKDAI